VRLELSPLHGIAHPIEHPHDCCDEIIQPSLYIRRIVPGVILLQVAKPEPSI
jgi:hypothetical protein